MGKIWVELPYNYDQEDLKSFLADHNIEHIKGRKTLWFVQSGDAFRFSNGVVARVMETTRNEVGEPYALLANKKFSDVALSNFIYKNV